MVKHVKGGIHHKEKEENWELCLQVKRLEEIRFIEEKKKKKKKKESRCIHVVFIPH